MSWRIIFLSTICCFYGVGCVDFDPAASTPVNVKMLSNLPAARPGGFEVGPPQTAQNLTIYILHGPEQWQGKSVFTLQDALSRRLAAVHEEGSVNQLCIENGSRDPIYVQAGDIVKGGQQDRTIGEDFVLMPRSGRVQIDAFCVENGRWTARGSESSQVFNGSSNMLASKELKLAAKQDANQGAVWSEVAKLQAGLSRTLQEPVTADASPSSLQLALENPRLLRWTSEYTTVLRSAALNDDRAIGFAFAINGHLNSADVYASHALFCKLWPKLLQAAAIESIAHLQDSGTVAAPEPAAIASALTHAESGQATGKQINDSTRVIHYDIQDAVLFETSDARLPGEWIHRNYILK
jgi:hypothetical protein